MQIEIAIGIFHVLMLLFWYTIYIPIHELGHATEVRWHTDAPIKIYFSGRVSYMIAKILGRKKYEIIRVKEKGNAGVTETDYASMDDASIKKIAFAGIKANLIETTIFVCILQISNCIIQTPYMYIINTALSLYMYFIVFYCWNKRYKEDNPSDKALYLNPGTYRQHI